jgi:pimeloyl-ACP methyl ester carboxylesterase
MAQSDQQQLPPLPMAILTQPLKTTTVQPSADQLQQTRDRIDAHIRTLDAHPDRREGAYPYYRFHEAGVPIQGTILLFHGFSAKPHQLWRLADYLFQNGFNIYQAGLAGHALIHPARNWPQVDLKPEFAVPLKASLAKDPVLQTYFNNLAQGTSSRRPNRLQQVALLARLIALEPRLLDIAKAMELADDPDFDRYFDSSHLAYLTEAETRLAELDALPGPVYALGLSVGGAVALALAAARPDRIKRVVSYAPLLKIYGSDRRQYINLAGPLDIQESGWDPALKFPIGCLTAADRLGGAGVLDRDRLKTLSQIPTLMVLTENEDAADIETNREFWADLGGLGKGHRFYQYSAADLVPHPMLDPTEVSQNMSNRFWQPLYQETLRFLTQGEIQSSNFSRLDQDPGLPTVPAL